MKRLFILTAALAACALAVVTFPAARAQSATEYEGGGSNTTNHNPDPRNCCTCITLNAGKPSQGTDGNYTVAISWQIAEGEPCDEVTLSGAELTEGPGKVAMGNTGGSSGTITVTITAEEVRDHDGSWKLLVTCDPDDLESTTATEEASTPESGCKVEFSISCEDGNCGSSGCDSNGEPGAENPRDTSDGDSSFTANIPTTRSHGGMTSGNVRFLSANFGELGGSFQFPGRAGLFANVPTDFTITRDGGGLVTSIDTGEATLTFADVPGQQAFTATHKDTAGAVFRTTTISHVEEDGTWRLRVDSTFDNAVTRHEQTRPAVGQFVLESGRVAGGVFQLLRRETVTQTTPAAGVRARLRKIEERAATTDPWETVSEVRLTEENQLHGWVTTGEVIDPAGAALTSTWSYYQPGEITGPGGSTAGLGRLKHHVRHDGHESFQTYTLNQEIVTTPYAGNPAGKTTTNTWDPGTHTRTVITTVGGRTLSHTVTSRNGATDTRTVHTGQDQTLTTTTHYVPSGQAFGGKPLRAIHPDGTLTTYSYSTTQDGGLQTVTSRGASTDQTSVSRGTRTTTITNSRGHTIFQETKPIGYEAADNVAFDGMTVTAVDFLGRPTAAHHLPANVTTETQYSCCGVSKETDMYGIPTFHAYDSLQRRIKTNRLGVTTEIVRKGLSTETHRYPETVAASLSPALAGTAATLVAKSVTNLAGTLQESWSPDPTSATPGALVKESTLTTYQPAAGLSSRTVTTTPDNFTQTADSFLDGRTAATSGDLAPAMRYAYIVNATGETTRRSYADSGNLRETTTTQSDWVGRTLRVDYMDGAFETMAYNALGQMVKSTDPDGVATLAAYNAEGERSVTAIDLNNNGHINHGIDSVSSSETAYVLDGSNNPVEVTVSKVWQDGDTNPAAGTVVSTTTRGSGGLSSSTQTIGTGNPSTGVTTLLGNGNWTVTSTAPDGTSTVTTYLNGRVDLSENKDADGNVIQATAARDLSNIPGSGHDALGRPIHQCDSRTGVTTTAYLSTTADFVASVTDPGSRTTAFGYDIRRRRATVDAPDTLDADNNTLANITTTHYFPDGTVQETTGGQTYRTTHTYDYAGRHKTLTTYGTHTATTYWHYSDTRGFLTRKAYHDGKGNDQTHTAAGRLETRTWARGVVTTYGYDHGGRLETVTYSNETNGHTTPNLVNTYDALNRLRTVTRGGVLHAEYTYRPGDLRQLAEIQQIDTLNQAVTYTYEDGSNGTLAGRANGFTFAHGAAIWSHDRAGRPSVVTDGTDSFTYGYRHTFNSGLHEGVITPGQGTESALPFTLDGPLVDTTLAYETSRDALAFRRNDLSGGTLSKFAYGLNALGQRVGLTPTGSAFSTTTPLVWGYNLSGELTAATRTGSPAFERAYSYDGIGNRLSATDHNAALTSYFADAAGNTAGGSAINQYARINDPGSSTLQPVYDDDGNLTSGPIPGASGLLPGVPVPANAALTWDAENRPVKAVVNGMTVELDYDPISRLIARTVGTVTTRYLYDGWNRIAEYESTGTGQAIKRTYLWGMDLSGTMQGAGGVGGLLSMKVHGGTTAVFYPTFDGNGNISEYVNQSGAKAAHFEYDPFGNLTVDSENNSGDFPYRFSTKPQDPITGLYYYTYRYYDPLTGRWPSRDPIGEDGGENLYGFCYNNPQYWFDYLGREPMTCPGMDDHGKKRSQEARNKTKDSHNEIGGGIMYRREYCGIICCKKGETKSTEPHPGTRPTFTRTAAGLQQTGQSSCDPTFNADTQEAVTCEKAFGAGWTLVAAYHSHARSEFFSTKKGGATFTDEASKDIFGTLYLGTPSGETKKWSKGGNPQTL